MVLHSIIWPWDSPWFYYCACNSLNHSRGSYAKITEFKETEMFFFIGLSYWPISIIFHSVFPLISFFPCKFLLAFSCDKAHLTCITSLQGTLNDSPKSSDCKVPSVRYSVRSYITFRMKWEYGISCQTVCLIIYGSLYDSHIGRSCILAP